VLQQATASNYEWDATDGPRRRRPSWCHCAGASPTTHAILTAHANLICWRHCAYSREPDYAQDLPL
jgi:hypothetical protein